MSKEQPQFIRIGTTSLYSLDSVALIEQFGKEIHIHLKFTNMLPTGHVAKHSWPNKAEADRAFASICAILKIAPVVPLGGAQ
jgi:hypothetical protein